MYASPYRKFVVKPNYNYPVYIGGRQGEGKEEGDEGDEEEEEVRGREGGREEGEVINVQFAV